MPLELLQLFVRLLKSRSQLLHSNLQLLLLADGSAVQSEVGSQHLLFPLMHYDVHQDVAGMCFQIFPLHIYGDGRDAARSTTRSPPFSMVAAFRIHHHPQHLLNTNKEPPPSWSLKILCVHGVSTHRVLSSSRYTLAALVSNTAIAPTDLHRPASLKNQRQQIDK